MPYLDQQPSFYGESKRFQERPRLAGSIQNMQTLGEEKLCGSLFAA